MAFLVFFFAARFISCHPAWKFFFNHFPVTLLEFPKRATNVNKAMSPRLRQRLHALHLKWRVTYRIGVHSGALSRAKHAQWSTMSKKIRLPMHPRNFGSHMTIRPPARPPIRPQHRHANVKKLKQQVWQPKCSSRFYLAGKRMAARTFREKK